MKQTPVLLKFLPFFILYILVSCRGKNHVSIPNGIATPDSMTAILTDVHLLQASAQLGFSVNPDDSTVQLGYATMLKKHHLTKESYDADMQFYCGHPKLLDSVYEKVLSNLNQQKAKLMGKETPLGK